MMTTSNLHLQGISGKAILALAVSPAGADAYAYDTKSYAKFSRIPTWVSLRFNGKGSAFPSTSTSPLTSRQCAVVENLYLISLAKQGKFTEIHEFVRFMDKAALTVSIHSFRCLFDACAKLGLLLDGKLLHDRFRNFSEGNTLSSLLIHNSILRMYCYCGSLEDADNVFDGMRTRDLISWRTIISAYSQRRMLGKAFDLLSQMLALGATPTPSVFSSLLASLADPSHLGIGKQLHSYLLKTAMTSNLIIATSISNMYVKCGWLEAAEVLFDRMPQRNAVNWTGLMVGYSQAGKHRDSIMLFANMQREGIELDEFVFSVVLKACAARREYDLGRQIHSHTVKRGLESHVSVGTPLVDFYVKCASLESASLAFGGIHEPNDVSWSAIVTGYCQAGRFDETVDIFKSLRSKGVLLNSFLYTSVLQACSIFANLYFGAQVHSDAIKRGLIAYLFGESALITMYSKCGRLDYAYRAFLFIDKPDTVAWTAIICAYAYHGIASEALRLFTQMQTAGVKPNAVTFIGVLTACSHSGLVTEGKQYMNSMSNEYDVDPTIDHYDCMIDIYSRAGLLQDALELIRSMPFEPDAMSWKSLLGGCWAHRNLEFGLTAAENLLQLEPYDTSTYVIMFNLHVSHGNWEGAAHFRRMMTERSLRKNVSCSWIIVNGKVHRFVVGDKQHPQSEEIYSKLEELKASEYTVDCSDSAVSEEDLSSSFSVRKEQLLVHSERLAIAYGLICTSKNTPVMIFKNIRSCKDCHDFAKMVSSATGREIIIRDANRFHHFKFGECSCYDFW